MVLTYCPVEEAEGPVDLKSMRKELESKGCIEVSYRFITNFRPGKKRSKPDTTPSQLSGEPDKPMPRKQLPTISVIPEKALKGDALSHQAM